MKKRREFTNQQKAQVALSVLSKKKTAGDAARELEVTPAQISRWVAQLSDNATMAFSKGSPELKQKEKKIQKLEYVVSKITTQNDFLEKVLKALE